MAFPRACQHAGGPNATSHERKRICTTPWTAWIPTRPTAEWPSMWTPTPWCPLTLRRQSGVNPGDEVVQHREVDLMPHGIFAVQGLIPLCLKERSRFTTPIDRDPRVFGAVGDE